MRRQKYRIIILFALLFLGFGFYQSDNFILELSKKQNHYSRLFPKENLFIHTDKTRYRLNDTLWFKAYIFDRKLTTLSSRSSTLHCLMVNSNGDIVRNHKFVIIQGIAYGDLIFDESMPEGFYQFVAYSSWMKNYDIEYVFSKTIEIRKMVASPLKCRIAFDKKLYKAGDDVKVNIKTIADDKDRKDIVKINYKVNAGRKTLIKKKDKIIANGTKFVKFSLPDDLDTLTYSFSVETTNQNLPVRLASVIPTKDVDLQFFPESGDWLHGMACRLAFKAIDEIGMPFDFEGLIVDENDTKITDIASFYKGMGSVFLKPEYGKRYFARITKPEGYNRKYPLPAVEKEGMIISLVNNSQNKLDIFLKSANPGKEKIYITVSMNRHIYWGAETMLKTLRRITIPLDSLPVGTACITLFNEKKMPVAERLVFVNKQKYLNISIKTDKRMYEKRERVNLTVKATDSKGNPVQANLSLAVVDSVLSYGKKSAGQSIVSYIALQSQLKGDIPTPTFYFNNHNEKADKALDLVMLTHGWRRIDWRKIISGSYKNETLPRTYDVISGTVYRNWWKKPVPNARVTAIQLNGAKPVETVSNDKGRFYFHPVFFVRDVEDILFVATSQKGRDNVKVVLDTLQDYSFRESLIGHYKAHTNEPARKNFATYRISEVSNENIRSTMYGDDYIWIPEIMVKAGRIEPENIENEWFTALVNSGAYLLSNAEIMQASSLNQLLKSMTRYGDGSIHFRNSINPAIVIIDDIPVSHQIHELPYISAHDIESIALIKSNKAVNRYGQIATNGAVIVKTKNGGDYSYMYITRKANIGVPQSYESPREFYSPKYDSKQSKTAAEIDLRTTLYWNPNILTDKNGEATVNFYNGDHSTTVYIAIEGITHTGLFGTGRHLYYIR